MKNMQTKGSRVKWQTREGTGWKKSAEVVTSVPAERWCYWEGRRLLWTLPRAPGPQGRGGVGRKRAWTEVCA